MSKADRIVTDAGDLLTLTKWLDGSVSFDIIDPDTNNALSVVLSKRDIDEMSEIIHRDDQS